MQIIKAAQLSGDGEASPLALKFGRCKVLLQPKSSAAHYARRLIAHRDTSLVENLQHHETRKLKRGGGCILWYTQSNISKQSWQPQLGENPVLL